MKRRRILYAAILSLLLPPLWAFVIELNRLVVTRAEIRAANLPPAFNGLRIVAISDLHGGSRFTGARKIERVVRLANQQNPDLIFLLGDYVTGNVKTTPGMAPEQVAALLKPLRARHGAFAILGNHDWWVSGSRGVLNGLSKAGIRVIDDVMIPIERGGARIWLLGIPDLWVRKRTDFSTIVPTAGSDLVIGLTHNPDVFPELNPPLPLVFAGHTHGGQVWLPFFGRLVVPSKHGERYAAGLIEENGRQLFVTTGVGTSILPVRFLVPPEIAVITLR